MLSIGEFSRLTHLSVRTLRWYHEGQLLEPAVVDETTGYRSGPGRDPPAAELAVTVHVGEHDGVHVTYGQLGTWVVANANAVSVAGPVREVYRVGPRDTSDPAAWRTEVGWRVFRVS